jgi:uncharacterized membrane protein YqjE
VRVLWSLPRAAPALLRHLAAYAELVGEDIARHQRELTARVAASAVVAVAVFFAVLMGCLVVIAITWDTHNRVTAIAWLGVGFLALAVAAALYRTQLVRGQTEFLSSVKREWREDRVILERILSADEDRAS